MQKIHFKTTIWLGSEVLEGLKELKNRRIFLVADPFLIENGQINEIVRHIDHNDYLVFSDIVPDPPIEKIVSGVKQIVDFQADIILTIGGGSAIDAAKAMKYFANRILTNKIDQLIAVPTTSGTGSEVTNFSIITIPERGTKFPLVTDEIQPDIAILDTNLVMGVPPAVTADTGMDVLTHILESYVSIKSTVLSDAYCEKAIKLVFKYLERAHKNGEDRQAREMMHLASCLAGIAFNQTSLGINHGIAHAAGARLHIPHGRVNGILLPSVIHFNADLNESGYLQNRTAMKYLKLAKCLGASTNNPRIGVNTLIRQIIQLRNSLKMPATLSEFGLEKREVEQVIPAIAEAAINDACTKTNPVVPSLQDIETIIQEIL